MKTAYKTSEKKRAYYRKWRSQNPEKARAACRAHYHANREKMIEKSNRYFEANPGYKQATFKKWYDANRGKERTRKLEYNRKRRASDPLFRLQANLRARIHQALKSRKPPSSRTMKSTGCTIQFLKGWLESRWQPGMSWENYGNHGWHVDHVIPCNAFDLSKPEEALQCFHYSNLQPLWAKENLKKGYRTNFARDGAKPKKNNSGNTDDSGVVPAETKIATLKTI